MKYERRHYPDGGVYAVIYNFDHPIIKERINTYEDLFFIKSLKDICDYNDVEVELFIPCMFQQQHDRRFNENESFELRIVADFINSCNFKRVYIHHPHSDVTGALINRSRVIDNHLFINEVLRKVGSENLVLMSSDAGGFKPLIKLADIIEWKGETESAAKSRDPLTHKLTQQVSTMDFKGKDVLIVDDICVYGGTFVGLGKIMETRNVGKMYLACSHVTVKEPSRELPNYYDRMFTTNSKYDSYDVMTIVGTERKPFIEIIKTLDL